MHSRSCVVQADKSYGKGHLARPGKSIVPCFPACCSHYDFMHAKELIWDAMCGWCHTAWWCLVALALPQLGSMISATTLCGITSDSRLTLESILDHNASKWGAHRDTYHLITSVRVRLPGCRRSGWSLSYRCTQVCILSHRVVPVFNVMALTVSAVELRDMLAQNAKCSVSMCSTYTPSHRFYRLASNKVRES